MGTVFDPSGKAPTVDAEAIVNFWSSWDMRRVERSH